MKHTYLWHVREAAAWDAEADRLEAKNRVFFRDPINECREKAREHRVKAAWIDQKKVAA